MELGKIETSKLSFTFDKFQAIIEVSLKDGIGYWAVVKEDDLPVDIREKYRSFEFVEILSLAIWYEDYKAKIYSASNPSLVLGEVSMPSVKQALSKMSSDYNEFFLYLMQEPLDYIDCDVFFQLATMGDVKFG